MVVEDDLVLADGLARVLEAEGFVVETYADGQAADTALKTETFSLLLLDIGLPQVDGFEILSRLRYRGSTMPVLLLTARNAIPDRVRGFDLGADDYVVKPFAIPELLGRVRALLRRSPPQSTRLALGSLSMDIAAQRAWLAGEALDLSSREWLVLEHLLRHAGKVVGKQQIGGALSGPASEVSQNAVEVYVSRLRGKLENADVRIRTIHGFGYMLEIIPA
ncbi:MAG: response regulator transcription factor [Solimonas sp.]